MYKSKGKRKAQGMWILKENFNGLKYSGYNTTVGATLPILSGCFRSKFNFSFRAAEKNAHKSDRYESLCSDQSDIRSVLSAVLCGGCAAKMRWTITMGNKLTIVLRASIIAQIVLIQIKFRNNVLILEHGVVPVNFRSLTFNEQVIIHFLLTKLRKKIHIFLIDKFLYSSLVNLIISYNFTK